jgi:hypothetical protein
VNQVAVEDAYDETEDRNRRVNADFVRGGPNVPPVPIVSSVVVLWLGSKCGPESSSRSIPSSMTMPSSMIEISPDGKDVGRPSAVKTGDGGFSSRRASTEERCGRSSEHMISCVL